jgi:hypothetical protein
MLPEQLGWIVRLLADEAYIAYNPRLTHWCTTVGRCSPTAREICTRMDAVERSRLLGETGMGRAVEFAVSLYGVSKSVHAEIEGENSDLFRMMFACHLWPGVVSRHEICHTSASHCTGPCTSEGNNVGTCVHNWYTTVAGVIGGERRPFVCVCKKRFKMIWDLHGHQESCPGVHRYNADCLAHVGGAVAQRQRRSELLQLQSSRECQEAAAGDIHLCPVRGCATSLLNAVRSLLNDPDGSVRRTTASLVKEQLSMGASDLELQYFLLRVFPEKLRLMCGEQGHGPCVGLWPCMGHGTVESLRVHYMHAHAGCVELTVPTHSSVLSVAMEAHRRLHGTVDVAWTNTTQLRLNGSHLQGFDRAVDADDRCHARIVHRAVADVVESQPVASCVHTAVVTMMATLPIPVSASDWKTLMLAVCCSVYHGIKPDRVIPKIQEHCVDVICRYQPNRGHLVAVMLLPRCCEVFVPHTPHVTTSEILNDHLVELWCTAAAVVRGVVRSGADASTDRSSAAVTAWEACMDAPLCVSYAAHIHATVDLINRAPIHCSDDLVRVMYIAHSIVLEFRTAVRTKLNWRITPSTSFTHSGESWVVFPDGIPEMLSNLEELCYKLADVTVVVASVTIGQLRGLRMASARSLTCLNGLVTSDATMLPYITRLQASVDVIAILYDLCRLTDSCDHTEFVSLGDLVSEATGLPQCTPVATSVGVKDVTVLVGHTQVEGIGTTSVAAGHCNRDLGCLHVEQPKLSDELAHLLATDNPLVGGKRPRSQHTVDNDQ